MTRLARTLQCTEGQAYTLIIGLLVATLLAIGGVPAAVRAHPANPPTPTTAPANPTPRGANP